LASKRLFRVLAIFLERFLDAKLRVDFLLEAAPRPLFWLAA
jgi:hypothetical protein